MLEPVYKLGLKPPRPDAVKLKLAAFFNPAKLPSVPHRFGRTVVVDPMTKKIVPWGMLGNDTMGCCVWSGGEHETMVYCADAGSAVPRFNEKTAQEDYSAVTGYVPGDDSTDQGTDMELAAAYRRKIGVLDTDGNRHKIDVYADLKVGDLTQLAAAAYFMGCAGIGVTITQGDIDAFNAGDVWDVSYPAGKELGGHYIPVVARNSLANLLVITWSRLHGATPAWIRARMLSGIVYFSRERLSSKGFSPQGYDAAALDKIFSQVTA